MIVVVMVGMTILFAYVAVYAQNYQTGVGSSILESMTIEDVWITKSQTPYSLRFSIQEQQQIWGQILI